MKSAARPVGVLLFLLLLNAPAAFAQDVTLFPGAGKAIVKKENLVAARQEALRQARRAVIETALASAVPALEVGEKRKGIESKILTQPDRFIVSFEVNRDGENDGTYEIVIEAKVDLPRLRRAVRELAAPRKKEAEGDGGILILIAFEKQEKLLRFEPLENALNSRFEMIGARPADASTGRNVFSSEAFQKVWRGRHFDELADIRESLRLSYFLLGAGVLEHPADECPEAVRFFFVDLKKRDVLLNFAYKLKSDLGCAEAARESAESIFPKLSKVMAEKGAGGIIGTVSLTVVVLGLRDYADMGRVRGTIEGLPLIRRVALQAFRTGLEAEYLVEYEGRPEDLAEAIVKGDYATLKIKEAAGPRDRLTFRAFY